MTVVYAVHPEAQGALPPHRAMPIFIGGQRRSGTTLMRAILNRHPHIALVPRETFFLQDTRFEAFFHDLLEWHGKRFASLGIGQEEIDRAAAAMVESLFAPFARRKAAHRWAEKSPENITRIDYLFRLFPEAQFIHMIRDPRDTLCSMKQQAATAKPRWAKFTAEVTAPEWVRCIEAGRPWRAHPQRYLEVRYEQLARHPADEVRRVLEFLGEPWSPTVLDSSADAALSGTADGSPHHQPVFTSSIGRWKRDLTAGEVACIEAIAGETMAQMGYEPATI